MPIIAIWTALAIILVTCCFIAALMYNRVRRIEWYVIALAMYTFGFGVFMGGMITKWTIGGF